MVRLMKDENSSLPVGSHGTAEKCKMCFSEVLNKTAGSEVLTAVATNVAIFWDIAQRNTYVNRRFGGTYCLYFQG
jgi:hypothetical protein